MVKPKSRKRPALAATRSRRSSAPRRESDRALGELREQTERLRLAQATAGMIVMDWDIENDVIAWSDDPAWLRGPLPASGRYPLYKDQVHPDDRERFLAVRELALGTLVGQSLEYRLVRTDGALRWVQTHQVVLKSSAGKARSMLVAIHDITQRRLAEQQARAADERLREAIEALNESIAVTDAEDRIVVANRYFRQLNGNTRLVDPGHRYEEHLRAGIAVGNYPGAVGRSEEWLRERLAARRRGGTLEVQRQDGKWLQVTDQPLPDGGMITFALDITQRKKAEQALMESEARFRDFAEASSDWYWETDAEDRYTWFGGALERSVGRPTSHYLGRTRTEVAAAAGVDVTAETWQMHRHAIERHEPFRDLLQRRVTPVGVIWMSVSGVPRFDAQGKFLGYRATVVNITPRKRAEEALLESEARFRDLANASGDWFWETDTEDRFVWLSESVRRFAGRGPAEYIGSTRTEIALGAGVDIGSPEWTGMVAAIARREAFRDVRQVRTPPGLDRPIWVKVSGVPRFDAEGRFLGYCGAVSDISAGVATERRARESDERLRAAIENLAAAISLTDGEDRIVIANRAFREMNGYTDFLDRRPRYEEHLRKALVTRGVPEAAGREEEWLQERLARRREGGTMEVKRGDDRWLQVTEQRLPDGGTITYALDITARKRAEEAVRETGQRFRALVELSSDFYWQTDQDHRFVLRAGEVLRRMGIQPESDYGKTRWELDYINMSAADWEAHRAVLARREEFRDMLLARRGAGGRIHWAAMSGRPLYDDAGAFAGYHGIGRDVTAQVEAEQALRKLNAELELRVAERTAEMRTAYQELESFSYSVSHDLRAPLRAISGFAGILREEESGRLSAEGLRHLAVIDANAQQMGKLVDALLELVRMSRHALVGGRLDMGAIARDVAAELAREYPKARIEIGPMPPAAGDATLIRQVYVNLVGNALKYSSQAGSPRVEIGAEQREEGTAFFVRDNGIGFDMAYSDKLFKPFERLNVDPAYKGTGIGLALASLIVHRHGGSIGAESAPGRGATFRFTLGVH